MEKMLHLGGKFWVFSLGFGEEVVGKALQIQKIARDAQISVSLVQIWGYFDPKSVSHDGCGGIDRVFVDGGLEFGGPSGQVGAELDLIDC